MNKEFEVMEFGSYPQGINGEIKPIEWIILDRKGKNKKKKEELLLLSKYALDYNVYHDDRFNVTWEKCYLRKWLNTEFFSQTFSEKEQDKIITASVSNNDNVQCGYANGYQRVLVGDGGEDTLDKVFLLSLDEVNNRLGVFKDETEFEKRYMVPACIPTKYVAERWASSLNENGTCNWWLRTPGRGGRAVTVEHVIDDIYIPRSLGTEYSWGGFVRPAIWIYGE